MRSITCLLLLFYSTFFPAMAANEIDIKDIELKSFPSSTVVSLGSLPQEKPLYVKFWASWCQPCMQQMPHFQELYQRYHDKINFVAVNIDINERAEKVQAVIARFGLTMPIWFDVNGQLASTLGLVGTPMSVLQNSLGDIVYTTHESDQVLDGFVKRLAEGQQLPVASIDVLNSTELSQLIAPYLQGNHYLFFTATWCDWYLAESRPEMAANCAAAQRELNQLSSKFTKASWIGIVNHLWTDAKALEEFTQKYGTTIPFHIDDHGALFQHFNVRDLPQLIKIENGIITERITDFSELSAVN